MKEMANTQVLTKATKNTTKRTFKTASGVEVKSVATVNDRIHLTFHIPESLRPLSELTIELSAVSHVNSANNTQELQSSLEMVEADRVEQVELVILPEAVTTPKLETSEPISIQILKSKPQEADSFEEVVPFFSLQLKNSASVYQVGSSFLSDIEKGNKHFGFSNMSKKMDDLHLLVYGSFINYSLKQPVLIIVRDINDAAFDKYRNNFTQGTLWKWKTFDWGNICFIDYEQINLHNEEFNQLDLGFITYDFAAILWALPSKNVQDRLQKASLAILSKISSVTMIANYGETNNKELKNSESYYKCFNIPLKGILFGEQIKKVVNKRSKILGIF
jgi:hypothetical protein